MRFFQFLFLFLLSISISFSQDFTGKVIDAATNTPLENVFVHFETQKVGMYTTQNGMYHITIFSPILNDIVTFSVEGYTSKRISFSILKEQEFMVYLSKNTEALDEVVVVAELELQPKVRFTKGAPMPKGIYNMDAELVNNQLYVIGGDLSYIEDVAAEMSEKASNSPGFISGGNVINIKLNSSFEKYNDKLYVYDIDKNTWDTPKVTFNKRAYHKTVHIDATIYVLGGKTLAYNKKYEYLEDAIEVFSIENLDITVDNTNPHQAVNFAAIPYDNNIIVMGGSTKVKDNGIKLYSNKVHVLDTHTGYWYELPPMPSAKEVNGIVAGTKMYLMGGFNERPLTTIESYNLQTGEWKIEGNLEEGIEYPALAYASNIIYMFSNGTLLTYDTITKTLNSYAIDLYLKSAQMHYYKGNLYIFGGYYEDEFKKHASIDMSIINVIDLNFTKVKKSTQF